MIFPFSLENSTKNTPDSEISTTVPVYPLFRPNFGKSWVKATILISLIVFLSIKALHLDLEIALYKLSYLDLQ